MNGCRSWWDSSSYEWPGEPYSAPFGLIRLTRRRQGWARLKKIRDGVSSEHSRQIMEATKLEEFLSLSPGWINCDTEVGRLHEGARDVGPDVSGAIYI